MTFAVTAFYTGTSRKGRRNWEAHVGANPIQRGFCAPQCETCQTSHKEVSTAQISPQTGTKSFQLSMNPPAVATETKTRKRASDAARKKRQRCNEHYVAQAKRLNSGKDFQQHSAKWIFELPKGAEKVASPKFIEGMVLSESGRVKIY